MASTSYLNMLNQGKLFVFYDFKPWGGGVAPTTVPIPEAKVTSVKLGSGSSFDTASIVVPTASFGNNTPYFLPLKIIYFEPNSGTQVVVFRGFVTSDNQVLNNNANTVTLQLNDYRWYISKSTKLRGRIYRNPAAQPNLVGSIGGVGPIGVGAVLATPPLELGSALSVGAQKFIYEKFRFAITHASGYLQNEDMVFNRNGFPDCYIDNSVASALPLFYLDDINYAELGGLPDDYHEKKIVGGFYWTYATILRHIERYWIEPYNSIFAGVELHPGDINTVSNIPDEEARPLNFNLQGQNPLSAVDSVVRSMPGKWMWYLDYKSSVNRVRIRIKEIGASFFTGVVSLVTGDNCEPLKDSVANVSSVTVKRSVDRSVKNVIARGGKIKVVTTVKLVPLWKRFANVDPVTGIVNSVQDFQNVNELAKYKAFIEGRITDSSNPLKFENDADKSEKLRYLKIYRYYGIPVDGKAWSRSIVDSSITSVTGGAVNTDLILTGDIANHYNDLTTNLKLMMFNGVRIDREIEAPQTKRFSDDIVIFLHDDKRDGEIKTNETQVRTRTIRSDNGAIVSNLTEVQQDTKWIIPEEESLNYKIDEKNGIVIFDVPQVENSSASSDSSDSKKQWESLSSVFANITTNGNLPNLTTRDVYMTATFTLDVSAIISKRIGLFGGGGISIVDFLGGPNFSEYIEHNDADIIVHNSAFYPLSADQKDADIPAHITDTMDGHEMGTKVRPAQSFDDYKFYESLGALELMTSINSFLEGHTDLDENVSAVLPYIETGYNLGDSLYEIVNSGYTGLKSYLNSISYNTIGESDVFNTSMEFNNNYSSSKTNDNVSNKNSDLNAENNKRQTLEYDNLASNILV